MFRSAALRVSRSSVTNRGESSARHIKVHDRFDAGLSHPKAVDSELEVKYEAMNDLAPGESANGAAHVWREGCRAALSPRHGVGRRRRAGHRQRLRHRDRRQANIAADARSHQAGPHAALRRRVGQVSRRDQEHRRRARDQRRSDRSVTTPRSIRVSPTRAARSCRTAASSGGSGDSKRASGGRSTCSVLA